MGARNDALKRYLSDNNVIADIFRLAFGADGLSVDPKALKDLDSVQVMGMPLKAHAKNAKDVKKVSSYRERIHDGVAAMQAKFGGKPALFVLGVEGQTKVSRVMPLRNLQYEDHSLTFMAERMAEGVRSKGVPGDWLSGWPKGAVLPTPLSVTLYTGAGDWTGPRSLREIQANIPSSLSRRVMDVPLNVLTFKDICKYDPDSLLSDLGAVAAYIVYEKDSDKLEELIATKEIFHHMSRKGFDVVNTHRKLAITIPEDVEVIDMHYAEQVWAKRAEKRGETNERQKNIGIFIDCFRSLGHSEETIATKLSELFKISYKEAITLIQERPFATPHVPNLS